MEEIRENFSKFLGSTPGFVHPLGSKRCTGKKKTEYSHDFRFEARRDESCFNSGTR